MEEPYQPDASILKAAFAAPAITPVIAIPLIALLPYAYLYTYPVLVLISIPVTFLLAIMFGYLGMLLVCLPICALLRLANRAWAIQQCVYTTILGTALWLLFWQWNSVVTIENIATYAIIGSVCSFFVSAVFCWLAGITVRPSGHRLRGTA